MPCKEISILPLIEKLDFIQDKRRWGVPFRRGCFSISEADFKRIAFLMGLEAKMGPDMPAASENIYENQSKKWFAR